VSEAQANRRGARRPAEDLDPRRAIRWLPLGFRAWLRPGGGTGTSCHVPVPVQALQVRRGMPIKDLVDRHRHGHDRLVLGRPLTKEGPGSFLVPPTVVHTAAEQDRDAARTRNPGYAATTRRAAVRL
jgi:hypothetical protein